MNILDWLILGAVAGYLLWLFFRPGKKKCSGTCAGCSACSSCGKCGQ